MGPKLCDTVEYYPHILVMFFTVDWKRLSGRGTLYPARCVHGRPLSPIDGTPHFLIRPVNLLSSPTQQYWNTSAAGFWHSVRLYRDLLAPQRWDLTRKSNALKEIHADDQVPSTHLCPVTN